MATRAKSIFFLLPLVLSSCGEPQAKTIEYPFHDISSYQYRAFYSDSFFSGDSTKADIRLASLGASMALISRRFVSKEEPRETKYATDFLQAIGMNEIYYSPSYYEEPTKNSIAYGIASKKINDAHTLVWTFVVSEGYGLEWHSNFRIGASGDAHGFAEAAATVAAGLKDFIVSKGIEGRTSVLVTGYSRGAAVSNLAAGLLDEEMNMGSTTIGKANISFKDTYAYCMETPSASANATPNAEKFSNIHNYINFNDTIPMVAPSVWGLHRLGVDHFFSDRLTDLRYEARRDAFLKLAKTIMGKEMPYPDDDWKSGLDKTYESYPSYGRYMHTLINDKIAFLMGSRDEYASTYQGAMGELICFFMEDVRSAYLIASIAANIAALGLKASQLEEVVSDILDNQYDSAEQKLLAICDEVFDDDGATKEIVAYLFDALKPLLALLPKAYDFDPYFNPIALMTNLRSVTPFHQRVSMAAWCMVCDPQYGFATDASWTNDGSYCRLLIDGEEALRLTGPDDAVLFESEYGEIVSSALSASIEDGMTSIYLPKGSNYKYSYSGSDDIAIYDVTSERVETLRQKDLPASGSIQL